MEEAGSYVCTSCKKAYPEPGSCPVHPEEPLLDASNREISFFLMQLDDQKRNKVYGFWITACLVLGAVLGIVLCAALIRLADLDFGYGKCLFFGGLAGGSIGTALAKSLFKPAYRQFTEKLEKI